MNQIKVQATSTVDLLARDLLSGMPRIEALAAERNVSFRVAAAAHLFERALWRLGSAQVQVAVCASEVPWEQPCVFSDRDEFLRFAAANLCGIVWERLRDLDDVIVIEYGQTARYLRSLLLANASSISVAMPT